MALASGTCSLLTARGTESVTSAHRVPTCAGQLDAGHPVGVLRSAQRTQWRSATSPVLSQSRRTAPCTALGTTSGGTDLDKWSTDDDDESVKPWAWGETKPATPLLDTVEYPVHLKRLKLDELRQLCREIRTDLIHTVSKTGGHLGSSLGVVELTTALLHVFNLPDDKIVYDVGHQAYVHKMLTGRRKQMSTIRQSGGLSGFTNRAESEYDPFGAGHSSTSISSILGMAVGSDFKKRKNHNIAVIGDGAITGGMAYEAMNHAGFLDTNMIVILNDNQQVSLPTQFNDQKQAPVGALSGALAKLQANRPLRELREIAKGITKQMPEGVQEATAKIDEYARGLISGPGSTLFEELGLYYIGPIDGHNLGDLIGVLKEVKQTKTVGPVLIHVITDKGRGYDPSLKAADRMHGVGKFDPRTGKQIKGKASGPSYTNVFADALIAEAERDSRIIGIHAAMGGGTGLNRFDARFHDRTFDVGIAEQHAVTFAAGLACEGLRPFCTIYSTFLQRGYDQIIHDVCLQNLPVRFAMDRAGLVGADGATHCGAFDITYMATVPNMVVMAPSDEAELVHMVATAADHDSGPICFRFPRGNGTGMDLSLEGIVGFKGIPMEIGKGRVRREGSDVALVGYGSMVSNCMAAAQILSDAGVSATVVDARFCKPLDADLLRRVAKEHPVMITVEEGAIGGFGEHVSRFLLGENLLGGGLKLKFSPMGLPDRFIEHGTQAEQLDQAGLSADQIANTALTMLGKKKGLLLPHVNGVHVA